MGDYHKKRDRPKEGTRTSAGGWLAAVLNIVHERERNYWIWGWVGIRYKSHK
jgi:hypothetical protein